jgi:two-component system, LytTR family, sensor kinase
VQLIAELGGILRELLRDTATAVAPLRDEIDLIGRYLAIEQVRFGDRLTIEWSVDPSALDAAVPPLILQPAVENAIRHGIVRGIGIGWLRIEAAVRADTLVLSVSDNGPDGPPPVTASARQPGHGLGLANTRGRLRRMYGDNAYLRLARTDRDITLVTIALPLTRIDPEASSPPAAYERRPLPPLSPQSLT